MKWFALIVVFCGSIVYPQESVITPLGPQGGMISVINGSTNDDVVMAVVRENGLFRSVDGGNSWQKIVAPLLNANSVVIHSVVFHPISSDTVLLATSLGMFRSNDKGLTFAVVPIPSPQLGIEYSLANPFVLFGSDMNGPLRSNDGGKTWVPLKDNLYFGNRYISRIAVHPADTGANIRLIAATGFEDTVGLFFSGNGGKNWRPFNKALPKGKARQIYKVSIDSMGIGRTHFRAVIGTAEGIYGAQSDLKDSAWTAITSNNQLPYGVVTSGLLVYDRYDPAAVDGDNHKFALYYASNASEYEGIPRPFDEKSGLFKISSKFNSLFNISILEPPPLKRVFNRLGDISSIFIPAGSNKSKIYLGTTNGIFVSTNDGTTWERKNAGLNFNAVRNVVSLSTVAGTEVLFAGIFGGGVMRSSDQGVTWTESNNGISSPYVVSLSADRNGNNLYAGSSYSLYRSTDLGQSWIELFKVDSSVILRPSRFINSKNEVIVRHSPVKSTNILFNSPAFGLRMTTNGGGTWTSVAPPVQTDSGNVPENIEFDPVDPSTIYYTGPGIFRSINAGLNWTDISSNLPKTGFNPFTEAMDVVLGISPTINPLKTNEIFLATTFKNGDGIPFRLFKTTNGGLSWDPMNTLLPVYDAMYDRLDDQRVTAGGPGGIFRTIDGGTVWKKISDSANAVRYFLLGESYRDNNILYTGSEQGVYRIALQDFPKLTIDTALYDFGSILLGRDSLRTIPLKNLGGKRNVVLTFTGLTDTISFRYTGPKQLNIPAGGEISVPAAFNPKSIGSKTAFLRFTTSDQAFPSVQITLRGHSFDRYPFEKFTVAFGTVTVNKDTVIALSIPNQSQSKLTISLLQNADSVNFSTVNGKLLSIDAGTTGSLILKYHPRSSGDHRAVLLFATSDDRFPVVPFVLNGTGIPRNYLTRKVLIDTSFGRTMDGTEPIPVYYRQLIGSLVKAGLSVSAPADYSLAGQHSILIVQPAVPIDAAAKGTLQQFVASGGTLVLAADHRDTSAMILNAFLRDDDWLAKFGSKTGLQFSGVPVFDSAYVRLGLEGAVVSFPVRKSLYAIGVDSILSYFGSSVLVDSLSGNAAVLFAAKSSELFTQNGSGDATSSIGSAATVAASTVGKGRIIAVSDPELWWNGAQEDTTNPFGVFGAQNLRLALNVFGSIENIVAELRETIEERYELISIPYSFQDSSVAALFKDLGEHNSYLWRMFGKYSKDRGYQEFPHDFTRISRGEGYWLITKEKRKVSLGNISESGVMEDFEMKIPPGYTIIGNPFPYAVSWTNSFVEDSVQKVLWGYTAGVYDSVSTKLEPFKGYWIFNRGKLPKVIRINAAPVTPVAAKRGGEAADIGPSEWKAQLRLTSSDGSDAMNFIGVLDQAKDGWDDHDFVKPPSTPSAQTVLALKNFGENLSADYRTYNSEGHIWDFTIAGAAVNEPIRISVEQFGAIPNHFALYIIDLNAERMHDIRTKSPYEFTLRKGESSRKFQIIAGTADFLRKNSHGIPIVPLEYALAQNFPNPFNPVTTIGYSIANSGVVSLEIFNILGQKVRTLVKHHQPIGTYAVTWDGKDNHGILLSSGIYYYQIQANKYRSVKKMTFIK